MPAMSAWPGFKMEVLAQEAEPGVDAPPRKKGL
jgi:hypothetical protein